MTHPVPNDQVVCTRRSRKDRDPDRVFLGSPYIEMLLLRMETKTYKRIVHSYRLNHLISFHFNASRWRQQQRRPGDIQVHFVSSLCLLAVTPAPLLLSTACSSDVHVIG